MFYLGMVDFLSILKSFYGKAAKKFKLVSYILIKVVELIFNISIFVFNNVCARILV